MMHATTRHTRLILETESLARATFTEILLCGDGSVGEVVSLQREFKTLIRLESHRYESLKAGLKLWRKQVTCGEVEFDPAGEDEFKGALRALIALEAFLIEKFDAYRANKGLLLADPKLVSLMQVHQQEAEKMLDTWESPEWETADERTVKWNKEQTGYLRERLGTCA